MPLGDVECVLHLGRNDEGTAYECYYYLVDHENRILFWMNDFIADDMIGEIDGVTDARHISTSFPPHLTLASHMYRVRTREQLLVGFLGTRCWTFFIYDRVHWELFPSTRQIPDFIVKELTGMLVHAGYGSSGGLALFLFSN
jgi:hypothetical protein